MARCKWKRCGYTGSKLIFQFTDHLSQNPPVNITTCVPLGYTEFRWATQIDPTWNIYLVALVLSMAIFLNL